MGFKRVYVAPNSGIDIKATNIEIVQLRTLREVIHNVFRE